MKRNIKNVFLAAFALLFLQANAVCAEDAGIMSTASDIHGKVIAKDSLVTFNYVLSVEGNVIDSSEGGKPMIYVHGNGEIIPALEEELTGLRVGSKKHIEVPPEKAYGLINPEAFREVPKTAFGDTQDLYVNMIVRGKAETGEEVLARVSELKNDTVVLDFNHPLAGRALDFDIEIIEVR